MPCLSTAHPAPEAQVPVPALIPQEDLVAQVSAVHPEGKKVLTRFDQMFISNFYYICL